MGSERLVLKHLRDGAFFFAKRIAESLRLELMVGGLLAFFLRRVPPGFTWNRSWNPKNGGSEDDVPFQVYR